jgi:hypothetical protein
MWDITRWVSWRTVHGKPVEAHGYVVTPVSRVLVARWPGGGVVWNRPYALVIARGTQTTRVRVRDHTRVAQVMLLAMLGFAWAYARGFGTLHKEKHHG